MVISIVFIINQQRIDWANLRTIITMLVLTASVWSIIFFFFLDLRRLSKRFSSSALKAFYLYTIYNTIKHPERRISCPIRHFFKQGHSTSPPRYLCFITSTGFVALIKIIIVVSAVELDEMSTIFPESQAQWCYFYISRA